MGFAKLSLKGRALKLLSQREHSRLELERKLAEHVEEGEDLAEILDALEQRGFISSERVAEFVNCLLAQEEDAARRSLIEVLRGFPIRLTRNLPSARSVSRSVDQAAAAISSSGFCERTRRVVATASAVRPTEEQTRA